jgi:hypothetical protein
MNVEIPSPVRPWTVAGPIRIEPPANDEGRDRYREREFGVGYGSSSGYAFSQHYAPAREERRFRVR